METLIEPNIHPVLVHFTYALMTTGAISLLLVSILPSGGWRDTLKNAGDWMLAIGAVAIVATVAAGLQAYYTVPHDGPSHAAMTTHRNWAVPTAIVLLGLAMWRRSKRHSRPSVLFAVLLFVAALSLNVTAWWGGKLVYHYGLGVSSMPQVTGDGHDHGDEVSDGEHDHEEAPAALNGDDAAATDENTLSILGSYPTSPEAVVNAFGTALRTKDEAAVRLILLSDVIIAEGGGAERSVEEYASHHMPADMEFTAAVEFSLKKRNVIEADDMTTVISESQVHGAFRDTTIHSRMMETIVLKKVNDQWRITHIHWSSAPIKGDHEH